MYTANENEENEEYTINSDSFDYSFSESDGTTGSESQQSPRKKKRWYFF
jgi:hypothetical protein